MPVFQGVEAWYSNFTLSCVIPLWDSATAHSPYNKELNPSSQEDPPFPGRCTFLLLKLFQRHFSFYSIIGLLLDQQTNAS